MRSTRLFACLGLLVPTVAAADDRPFGLDRRIPWNDSKVVGSPDPPSPYKTVRAFPKLTVKQPLAMLPEPGTDRLLVLQHLGFWSGPGRLLAMKDDQDTTETELLLEIDGIAYGLAFHPDYERNGYLYVGMNAPHEGGPKFTRVVRYTVDRRPPHGIVPDSAVTIIEWPSDGHNGGDLAFGNDGFLYVSSGDGTSDSDRNNTGQTLDDLLGAVLRIDVDHRDEGRRYAIPRDNPFVDRAGARPELWAYGLRNPWRLSFDKEGDQLWVGNNGQDLWEQVYLIRKGANYGWSVSEGSHTFHARRQAGPDPIAPPAAEHHHSEARSLTGGRVYRGDRLPELRGAYLYGDHSTGRIWGLRHDGTKATWHRELVDTPFNITGFGTDHRGESYVFDQVGGTFQRLEPNDARDHPAPAFPTKLGETGLFTSVADHRPHPALIAYDVVAPGWADGANAERFLALPGDARIELTPKRGWNLPEGSVVAQTLSLDVADAGRTVRKRIETRLLTKQQGEWVGYSYRWDDAQTDAELVPSAGDAETFEVATPDGPREQIWRFPSRAECLVCHSRAANFVLGLSGIQMDRDFDYSGRADNQLRTLDHIGLFSNKPEQPPPGETIRLANPYDQSAPIESRARSYLHVNCAPCHVEAGGGNAKMELEITTPSKEMRLIDIEPLHDRFEIADARLVAPGSPERSVLLQRIGRRGTGQMPPLVTTEIDTAAIELLKTWIREMPGPAGAARQGR